MTDTSNTKSRPVSGLAFFGMLFLLVFLVVYAIPEWRRSQAERDIVRIGILAARGGGGAARIVPNQHWLKLDSKIPSSYILSPPTWDQGLLQELIAWQRWGGIPRLSLREDFAGLASLSAEERQEFYTLLRRVQILDIDALNPSAEDLRFFGKTPETVIRLKFSGQEVTAEKLALVKRLRWLSVLNLSDTNVGDADLKGLAASKTLRILNLAGTKVTGAGLAELKGIQLLTLDLSRTRVDDAGMKELAAMAGLASLNLAETAVGDAGLKELTRTQIQQLNLAGTAVTDAGMKELVALRQFNQLNLSRTAVGDAGIKELAKIDIRSLDLSGTAVTNAGMAALSKGSGGSRLLELNLSNTAVDDAGILELGVHGFLSGLRPGPKATPAGIKAFEKRRQEHGGPF